MNAPIAILLLSTESVAQFLHDSFCNYRPDKKQAELPPVEIHWLSKAISPGFEYETQMWRHLAEDLIKWLQKQLGNAAQPHPLAAVLLPVGQGQSAQPLKNASGVDSIRRLDAELSAPSADMASPEVRLAIQAQDNPAVLHERIAQLTAEVKELNALLIDRTAEAAQLAGRAKRAEEERDRKRAAENELIRDRDRLIHKDIADLRGELENERAARAIYSDRLNKSDAELKASQDRERRLTERLAQIAGLVSDL